MEQEHKLQNLPNWKPPEEVPPITDFFKWLSYHLRRDWPVMVKAPIALLAVVVFALFLAWLCIWQVVIPEKNEQLSTKQAMIDSKQDQIDRLTKERDHAENENGKLRAENASYTAARADKSTPLKGRAKVLATQLVEFADRWEKDGKSGNKNKNDLIYEWRERFHSRLREITAELDALGQFSPKIGVVGSPEFLSNLPSAEVIRMTSSELIRMADAVPESP